MTELGIVREVREVMFRKAVFPIVVTELGITRDVREFMSAKA